MATDWDGGGKMDVKTLKNTCFKRGRTSVGGRLAMKTLEKSESVRQAQPLEAVEHRS
jgi:hypothetical protein